MNPRERKRDTERWSGSLALAMFWRCHVCLEGLERDVGLSQGQEVKATYSMQVHKSVDLAVTNLSTTYE